MKRYLGISFAAFCGALLFAGVVTAKPATRAEIAIEEGEIDAVGDVDGVMPAPSKALQDTVWIADWSFDSGGSCVSTGWVKYDNRILSDGISYWVIDNRFDSNAVITNNAAVLSKHDLCWAQDGYGNDWDQSLILKYQGVSTLTFKKLADSEPGFDFLTVECDSAGASEARANVCTNPKATAETFRTVVFTSDGLDNGSTVGPLALTNFGAGTHEAYIRFEADGGYSDEDGLYPTAWAAGCAIDDIVMTGTLAYSENWEAAPNANITRVNTAQSTPFCAAPWARLFSHITDNDKCTEDITCAWLGTDPLRIFFFADMSFAPGQAVIHNWLDDIIVSPWVSLASTPTATGTVLSFRRFPGNLFTVGLIVQGWRVRSKSKVDNTDTPATGDSIDCVSPWGHASSFNSLNTMAWITSIFDMTTNFTPTARDIQVSFRTGDWQHITGAPAPATLNTGPGPFTDRVRIGRRVLTGPVINVGIDTRTQAQDCFPTVQNAISPGQHFSPDGANRFGTCAFSEGTELGINLTSPNLITGDSITLAAVVDSRGAGGIGSVKLLGAIVAGPHVGKAPAPFTVGGNGFFEVNADSARNSSGVVVANAWFVDMDDTYFRGGDKLVYAWLCTDNLGGVTSSPSGLTAAPTSVAQAQTATQGLREVSYLPTINWDPDFLAAIQADANGDLDVNDPAHPEWRDAPVYTNPATAQKNCILYYQKLTSARRDGDLQRTSFMHTMDTMGYRGHYDIYDTQGYGNTNNQLGGRATVAQASGYALIIQDDGRSNLTPNVPDGVNIDSEKVNQAQWYRDYLSGATTGVAGTASLWILGENTAFEKRTNALFTTDMGLSNIQTDQGLSVNPNVRQSANPFSFASGAALPLTADEYSLNGGCPAIRAYDVAGSAGTSVVTHNYRAGAVTGGAAIIMNKNAVLKWNTVWTGHAWFDIRDAFGGTPGTAEVTLATKVFNGTLPVGCILPVNPTDVPPGDGIDATLPRVSSLHQNVPNPFNPTTKIRFDLARNGHVKLQVFNVAGQLVKTLVDGALPAKRGHEVTWNGLDEAGRRAASGVYFYQLVTDDLTATKKMALLK